jgi:phosphatidylglycerol:prolipoprotein diacylglycerol transferase
MSVGPFHLYGYGAMIVLGGYLASLVLRRHAARVGLKNDDDFWLLINVIFVGGFLGGRILYLFEYTAWFSRDFWATAFSLSRGFSVLGSFLGVPLGVWLFCRARGVKFLGLFDFVCVLAPFWHVFGRFGCLLAGCCHGRPTAASWGLVFRNPAAMVPQEWLGVPLYPTQLFEAAGNALIAFALYRIWLKADRNRPGLVAALYFGSYGVLRFFSEFYRGDELPSCVSFLTAGQLMSVGLVAVSAALLGWRDACSRPS